MKTYIELFYRIKPFIPRRLQISLRRVIAFHKLKTNKDTWPINLKAAKEPEGWTGWPGKKKFALILSHDVDTANGYKKCTKLMELEEHLGFRSSFNFVLEDYRVSAKLRWNLTEEGFEVGVHGLKHDGKLFKSRKIFEERAPLINQYLKDWEAVGFRAPSMHHNLEWISELDIEHDNSTFDTDPFEPQPDGIESIFPQWITNKSQTRGYVELPYTLPQDHCLFVILKEKDTRIWKEKLDWIVQNGGLALLNTHPDYMNFNGDRCPLEEYPISHYKVFLEYIKTRYSGQYWHVLPRELARFWKKEQNSECKNMVDPDNTPPDATEFK
ncbi:MAG: hypothetical protein MUP98_06165 [Candidatus Aminicenantes bacterium]|nr:hypothetical protein [Candidatus Aminicenantes bacterium]